MPTLDALGTKKGMEEFKESIISYSKEIAMSKAAFNSGINDSQDIEAMYQRGDETSYDYSRVISDAESYI